MKIIRTKIKVKEFNEYVFLLSSGLKIIIVDESIFTINGSHMANNKHYYCKDI